jgi:hypothetical protein
MLLKRAQIRIALHNIGNLLFSNLYPRRILRGKRITFHGRVMMSTANVAFAREAVDDILITSF